MGRFPRSASVAVSLVLAACGNVGPKVIPSFNSGVIGPGGGSMQAGAVSLVLPPGSLVVDTVVAILAQPDPLPVDPMGPPVTLMPGLMCIGPVGQDLGAPGHVQFCYDPATIPPGFTEADVVLLEWDNVAGFLRIIPAAAHDTNLHCFDHTTYGQLGHIGVGIVTGQAQPPFDFVFFGQPVQTLRAGVQPQGEIVGIPTSRLVLADTTGTNPPLEMDGTEDAQTWIPSHDGSRVLFSRVDLMTDGTNLLTVDVATAGPFAPREVVPGGEFSPVDGHFGWLGDQDRVYHARSVVVPEGGPNAQALAAANGDGIGSIVNLKTRVGNVFVDDVRISPDQTKVLIRWIEFSKGVFNRIDVIDAVSGADIGTDLLTATDLSDPTPRWLPDSSGIYFVEDDGTTVTRIDPDGGNPSTLYTMTVLDSGIIDFIVSPPFQPDPPRCAFVRRDFSLQGAVVAGGPDFFCTDTLAGDDFGEFDLENFVDVLEFVPLYSEGFQTSLCLIQLELNRFIVSDQANLPSDPSFHTLVFTYGGDIPNPDPVLWTDIPAPISNLDVGRGQFGGGEFLVLIDTVDENYPDFPSTGIYHLDSFAGNPELLSFPGLDVQGPPRWLESWRHAPGFDAFNPRVR